MKNTMKLIHDVSIIISNFNINELPIMKLGNKLNIYINTNLIKANANNCAPINIS